MISLAEYHLLYLDIFHYQNILSKVKRLYLKVKRPKKNLLVCLYNKGRHMTKQLTIKSKLSYNLDRNFNIWVIDLNKHLEIYNLNKILNRPCMKMFY
jgi:hypothetical protein